MHSDSLVSSFQKAPQAADLSFYLKPDWSSSSQNNRSLIRQFIFDHIESNAAVLDLEQAPKLNEGAVSISHNKEIGGFVHLKTGSAVGFDIECSARLKKTAAHLYASETEIENAPTASALWTAKEAAFKWLHQNSIRPTVIKEIELGNWSEISPELYSCEVLSVQGAPSLASTGLVSEVNGQTMAIFKTKEDLK